MVTETSKFLAEFMGYQTELTLKNGNVIAGGLRVGSQTSSVSLLKAFLLLNKDKYPDWAPTSNGFELSYALIDSRDYTAVEIWTGPDSVDAAVLNKATGKIFGSIFNPKIGKEKDYIISTSNKNGTAILLAILPSLISRFPDIAQMYQDLCDNNYSDIELLQEDLVPLSDRIYYLIKGNNQTEAYKMKLKEETKQGELRWKTEKLTMASISGGAYTPKGADVLGNPTLFVLGLVPGSMASDLYMKNHKGRYAYGDNNWDAEQQSRIPDLDDNMVVSAEALEIAKKIQFSRRTKRGLSVLALTGPAGTGKTVMCKQIAAMIGRPYRSCNGSPDMERFDVVAQLMPNVDGLARAPKMENLHKALTLPSIEDVMFDIEGSYEQMTGEKAPIGYSLEECLKKREALLQQQMLKASKSDEKDFTMVLSELVKGLQNGEVVEFMEADLIRQAGVLASLNNILDINSGVGTLPNGETFKVSKDAVVIFTMNLDLEGCNSLNQSFMDRLQLMKRIDEPEDDVIVKRVLHQTDCKNKEFIKQAVDIMRRLKTACQDNGITDGVVGVRSVISWVQNAWMNESLGIADAVAVAARDTIINKSTTDQEQRDAFFDEYISKTTFESPIAS